MDPHSNKTQSELIAGLRFCGTATQSGTMLQDGHRFEAIHHCEIEIVRASKCSVECVVRRVEIEKFVDCISYPDGDIERLPPYLRSYLRDMGSCEEPAIGTFDPFSRVLLLKGTAAPTVTGPSDVLWSPHFYSLVMKGGRMVGTAFCMDGLTDRENGVGSVDVSRT